MHSVTDGLSGETDGRGQTYRPHYDAKSRPYCVQCDRIKATFLIIVVENMTNMKTFVTTVLKINRKDVVCLLNLYNYSE